MGPTGPVRSRAGALWRAALCPRKSLHPPTPTHLQGKAPEPRSLPFTSPLPAGSPYWSRQRTSPCSSRTLSLSANSTSLSKCGYVLLAPDPPCLVLPDLLSHPPPPPAGPMPWTPGTPLISSAVATTHVTAPTVLCSASGISWLQLEGCLRTWHCW